MKRLAVLISSGGTGSTLKAIIEAINNKELFAVISVVISDAENSKGFEWIKNTVIPRHVYNSKQENLDSLLTEKYPSDYIVLAGWKKMVSDKTIDVFTNRILNIHPGLIPDVLGGVVKNPDGTEGLWNRGRFMQDAIQNFLESSATYAGSTVHFLSHEFDFGLVINRCFEKILPNDTVATLYSRLKIKEHEIYIRALKKLCNNQIN